MRLRKVISLAMAVVMVALSFTACDVSLASACSIAAATGDRTNDGRPVLWKNRDSWGSSSGNWNGWQVKLYLHNPTGISFGAGDRWGDRFKFTGVTDTQSFEANLWINDYAAWAGVNEKGLGLVMGSAHNLRNAALQSHGYTPDQDQYGIDGGQLNFFILSRCETIADVEQFLSDTNNGGGFRGNPNNAAYVSTARNTSCIIMVCDKNGDTATFEISDKSFMRDNVNTGSNYVVRDANGYFTFTHTDDKNVYVPVGSYNGIDYRTNFCRIIENTPARKQTPPFPFFVDTQRQTFNSDGTVTFYSTPPDGIHDWETTANTVARWGRVGDRMNHNKDRLDYRIFMQKTVPASTGIGNGNIETLSRYIGDMSTSNTNYWPNRHVTTFSVVIKGTKSTDVYKGKLTTMWVALGEPSCSIFVPVFPFANQLPAWSGGNLDDMYTYTNAKRHQVYSYTTDNATGELSGRNTDRTIDLPTLCGGYYGQSGIQQNIFATENYYFTQHENFLAQLRTNMSDDQLRTMLRNWQNATCQAMKNYYVTNTHP